MQAQEQLPAFVARNGEAGHRAWLSLDMGLAEPRKSRISGLSDP